MKTDARAARTRRHARVRTKLLGTSQRPRLCVFRSLKHIYAQVIDDERSHTLAAASSQEKEALAAGEDAATNKAQQAARVGSAVAQRALEAGVSHVVFDRGGYKYHGRVKVLADAARTAGLKF